MPRRTKDEAAETREGILEAATDLFLQQGVARTSLDQIAKHANCTRGAVYHHFANKEELLREMLESVRLPIDELFAQTEPIEKDKPLEAIQLWCERAFEIILASERSQRIHTVFYHRCEFVGEMNPARESEMEKIRSCHDRFVQQFARAEELGQLREDLTPEEASYLMHSFCTGFYSNMLKEPWNGVVTLRPKPMIDVFFQGISSIKRLAGS